MIFLQNGCSYSGLSVSPSNWDKARVSLRKKWYIFYRFYSPDCPKGKLKVIKSGLNQIDNLPQRREAVRVLLKLEKDLLENQGYNPILNVKFEPEKEICEDDYIISPKCGFVEALQKAYGRLELADSTKLAIRGIVKGIEKGAWAMQLTNKPVGEIKRRNIIALLDYCGRNNPRWSNIRYNKYRSYLLMLFKELLQVEAIEYNLVRDISRKKEYKKIREVLTIEQRKQVNTYLHENYYTFWRFLHIFFHSGARETELMRLTKEKVFLKEQYFIVTVLKRGEPTEVRKPIKSIIKHLWEEVYNIAKPGQYLFSKFLQPGEQMISAWQISTRWRVHVKQKLGITADFYSLKHTNLDEVEDILSLQEAARLASHLRTTTTEGYTIGKELRDLKKLQNIDNAFA